MMRDRIHEIARAESALWSLDPGTDRAEWVKVSTAAKAAGIAFDTWHDWCAGAGNYRNESDCRSVWQSISNNGGIGPASLFYMARANGWRDESSSDFETVKSHAKPLQSPAIAPKEQQQGTHPAAVFAACKSADASHPYITRKGGNPSGLAVYHGPLTIAGKPCDGALVLPAMTLDGELASLQFVTNDGKLFLPGRKLPPDACLTIGDLETGKPVFIVEGIGQAWSAHKATGCASVVCFGWGRVAQVAQAIQQRHPGAALVLVPDGGKESQAADIARALNCRFVELPPGTLRNGDINDIEQAEGIEAVSRLLESAKAAPQRFQLLTPAELAELPPISWRIRGVLPKTGIAALFGPSGSGKSFLALDMLAATARGAEWFGCKAAPCPVLYAALEGEAGISQRIRAHQMKHGPLPSGFRFLLQGFDIRKPTDRTDLIAAAHAAGYSDGVLTIDTLNRAAPGADENDSAAMGEIIAGAKLLQAELGGLVLLVHHTGKDATKGLRGHSSLHAALDAAIVVTREGDRREWATAKSKDGDDSQGCPFRLEVMEIDTDDDGKQITSCVVTADEQPGEAMRRVLPPKSGNQRIVWDELGKLFRAAGCFAPEGAPKELPGGRPCLRLEDAIAKTRSSLVCDAKRQTERTQSAINGLVARGLLVHREGWIWCA